MKVERGFLLYLLMRGRHSLPAPSALAARTDGCPGALKARTVVAFRMSHGGALSSTTAHVTNVITWHLTPLLFTCSDTTST